MSEPVNVAEMVNQLLGGFNELLGLRYTRVIPGLVEAELELGPQHHQPYGLVHGGVYATVVESVCSTGGALAMMDQGWSVVGRENTTTFLRATRGGLLRAQARCESIGEDRHGRPQPTWVAELRDEADQLVARGRVTLSCLEPGRALAGETVAIKSGD